MSLLLTISTKSNTVIDIEEGRFMPVCRGAQEKHGFRGSSDDIQEWGVKGKSVATISCTDKDQQGDKRKSTARTRREESAWRREGNSERLRESRAEDAECPRFRRRKRCSNQDIEAASELNTRTLDRGEKAVDVEPESRQAASGSSRSTCWI